MPYYVNTIRIDWHGQPADDEDLDSTDHTLETFEEQLTRFAEAHRDAVIDALVEDGFRVRWFFHARGGEVTSRTVYPVLDDVDHDCAIKGIDLEYGSEADLIADVERASNLHASGTMVADVDWDRYLVRLAGGGADVHKAYPVDPALFERLVS